MNCIDELKVVITLAGNQRLPHLEEEIFADKIATNLYLSNLCNDIHMVTCDDDNLEYWAYVYAKEVLHARWPAAEHVIARDPAYAYYYAIEVIDGRFVIAEFYIQKNDYWWSYYLHSFQHLM